MIRVDSTKDVFTNSFYVEIHGNPSVNEIHKLAKRSGFINLGPVSLIMRISHTRHSFQYIPTPLPTATSA